MVYNEQHQFYCGVDLRARSMFTHILDKKGKTVFEEDLPADPEEFLHAIKPFRKNLVVGCECMFAWYWLTSNVECVTRNAEFQTNTSDGIHSEFRVHNCLGRFLKG